MFIKYLIHSVCSNLTDSSRIDGAAPCQSEIILKKCRLKIHLFRLIFYFSYEFNEYLILFFTLKKEKFNTKSFHRMLSLLLAFKL